MSRQIAAHPAFVLRNDYSSTNVTTGAWVQLSASLTHDVSEIEIFDSSGSTLQLAYGPVSGEVVLPFDIMPGGNAPRRVLLNKGMRLSIRAIDADATSGEFVLNASN